MFELQLFVKPFAIGYDIQMSDFDAVCADGIRAVPSCTNYVSSYTQTVAFQAGSLARHEPDRTTRCVDTWLRLPA